MTSEVYDSEAAAQNEGDNGPVGRAPSPLTNLAKNRIGAMRLLRNEAAMVKMNPHARRER